MCLQHVCRDAARRAGSSATTDTCFIAFTEMRASDVTSELDMGRVNMSNLATFSSFSAHNHIAILTESFPSCSPKISNESGSLQCSLFCFL